MLKRVRGTPLPTSVYLAAVIASTLVVIALETAAQVAIGRFLLGADWPAAPGSFVVALVVGAMVFAVLGLATTGLIRSAQGSSAVVNAIYLPLTFVSGVFFSVEALPRLLEMVARVSPLTHLLELLRSVFVEGDGLTASAEPLVVLAVWGVGGAVLALRMFRWEPHEA